MTTLAVNKTKNERRLQRFVWNIVTFVIGAEALIVQLIEAYLKWDIDWSHFFFTTADGWMYFTIVSGAALLHAITRPRRLSVEPLLFVLLFFVIALVGMVFYGFIYDHPDFDVGKPVWPYEVGGGLFAIALFFLTQRYLSVSESEEAEERGAALPPV